MQRLEFLSICYLWIPIYHIKHSSSTSLFSAQVYTVIMLLISSGSFSWLALFLMILIRLIGCLFFLNSYSYSIQSVGVTISFHFAVIWELIPTHLIERRNFEEIIFEISNGGKSIFCSSVFYFFNTYLMIPWIINNQLIR